MATRATVPRAAAIGFDALELSRRLDVDRPQAERHRLLELLPRLADAGEDDVGGGETGAAGDLDFPDGVGVDGAAQLAEQLEQRRTWSSP